MTAEYVRYVTTLASDASRASGRSVFLLDGDFDDEATLTVTQAEEPELVDGKVAVEQWHLACSDASQQSYTVRYLTPEETAEGYDVFVRAEDGWQKADCSEFGSYLVFTVAAAEADVAILPAAGISLALALGCAAAVLVLLIVLVVLCRRRAKGRKRPAPAQAAQVPPVEPRPARKKKRWVPVLLVVLAVAALCAVVGVKLAAVVDACGLLEEFASRTESVMTLTMDLQLDDSLTTTEMEITHTQVEGQAVTCIQNSGISLYYANGAVIMENGRAFQVSDLHPDYSLLPQQAAKLFGALSFSTSRSDGNVTCRLTAEGDNARQLLEVLLPEQADYFSDTQKLTVELTASKDELTSLTFFSEGTMADDAKTSYTLSGELRPESTGDELAIPDAVKQTVLSGSIEGEAPLSEDLFRLLSAWTAMSRQDSFSADVQLGVDCGPISLGENLKYGQALVESSQIGCVRKNDLSVYFSGGVFCDQNATVLTEQDEPLADRVRLLETLKQVCLNGEYDCTDTGNGSWLYTLTLDEAAMEAVAYAAAPEMEALPVTLSSGSVQVIVSSSAIREISFSCTGGLEELEEVAPVTVSAKLTFASDGEFDIPTAVADRLTQERMEENGQ